MVLAALAVPHLALLEVVEAADFMVVVMALVVQVLLALAQSVSFGPVQLAASHQRIPETCNA
jgi:hypothetical protein